MTIQEKAEKELKQYLHVHVDQPVLHIDENALEQWMFPSIAANAR